MNILGTFIIEAVIGPLVNNLSHDIKSSEQVYVIG